MYRLIVVEDEPEIRKGLVEQLPWAELGFEVVDDFESGNSAITYLSHCSVDVVLTDVKMEAGNGFDIAEFIHSHGRLETVVFYSAYRDFDFARKGMFLGVKRYITKDMSYAELIQSFRDLKHNLDCEIEVPMAASPDSDGIKGTTNPIVRDTIRYLRKAYKTATLENAAKVVKLNPYYLSSYIKVKTGENFRDILTRIRMEKAKELLKDPTYRVGEIGELLGYRDGRNFSRCFKNYYGRLPHECREDSGVTAIMSTRGMGI